MRDEAERRIGHLYPQVEITEEMVRERPDLERYKGRKLTVIEGLWARTVRSPNPAFADVEVPLASTFMLSTNKEKESYVEPVVVGGFVPAATFIAECLGKLAQHGTGIVLQHDAMTSGLAKGKVVSTDPPYYDNVGYADLSDFFYVWLRRSLRPIFPDLFATLAVPKAEELVATPYRHGNKEKAESFFLSGMTDAMRCLAEQAHSGFPVTIYYAFKQSETKGETGTASTGWETFLAAVIQSGFSVTGTWPMRTELSNRMIGAGANALASSIVLVCRQRPADAPMATRREFVAALRAELPTALAHLQSGNIAPVDLAQAAIGPGMAVFTRYAKVLDAEGNPVSVREALALINQMLDEVLAEQEGDFDPDSRWALAWFEQQGFDEGEYGVAETLSEAKNTSIAGIVEGGILASSAGKVRLLRPDELAGLQPGPKIFRLIEDGNFASRHFFQRFYLSKLASTYYDSLLRLGCYCRAGGRMNEGLAASTPRWPRRGAGTEHEDMDDLTKQDSLKKEESR